MNRATPVPSRCSVADFHADAPGLIEVHGAMNSEVERCL
jgi:hypothetical protein